MTPRPQEPENPAVLKVEHIYNRCATAKCKGTVTVAVETAKHEQQSQTVKLAEVSVLASQAEEAEAEAKRKAEEEAARLAEAAAAHKAQEEATRKAEEDAKRKAEEAAKGGVEAYIAKFAGSSALSVTATGVTKVSVSCPVGGACKGTLTLQTLKAVSAKAKKKRILVLAKAPFSRQRRIKGDHTAPDGSREALLRRSHGVLKVKLTVLSRPASSGQQSSSEARTVSLRLAKSKQAK